jgi:hypothetical protein
MNTYAQLRALHAELTALDPNLKVAWSVGVVFNELLKQVKTANSDNEIIGAIQPVSGSQGAVDNALVRDLRILTGQLLAAYE